MSSFFMILYSFNLSSLFFVECFFFWLTCFFVFVCVFVFVFVFVYLGEKKLGSIATPEVWKDNARSKPGLVEG